MDSGNLYDVSAVFRIEIVKIRSVLEVVGVNLAAFNYIVGLNIIGEFLDVKSNVFLGKYFLCYRKYLGMGRGRSSNGNLFSLKSGIINRRVKAVTGVFNNAYNRAVVFF